MFLIHITLLMFLLVLNHSCGTDLDISFQDFQVKHQKNYKTAEETELRLQIFNSNMLKIQEHNKRYEQGLETYMMGVNQFADITLDEFAAWLNKSLIVWPQPDSGKDSINQLSGTLPDSIDWRKNNVVTNVKNQGDCGACWAFSATGSLESQLAINTGRLISLSEQELLDCNTRNGGCQGGVVQYAYEYVKYKGLSATTNYSSYTATAGTCRKKNQTSEVQLKSYVTITAESELQRAVGLRGPVAIALNADYIQFYKSGIFSGSCSSELNHGVLAVGYGTDNETGLEYWIMKNSWGSNWGEEGYFRIVLGMNLCGLATCACYPILYEDSPNDDDDNTLGFGTLPQPLQCLNLLLLVLVIRKMQLID